EKLEDEKISNVEDGIKGDHFPLNKKRIIDNIDDSSTKKKMNNRIRVAEMTLNESELEVLSGENLEEVENKAALLYAEYKTDKSKEPVLEKTLVSKANLNVEDKDKIVVDKDSKILKRNRELMFPIAPNIHQERINRHKQAYGLVLTGGIL
ncbi:14534_t:CDS:2, partial [Gigaspora margarita]